MQEQARVLCQWGKGKASATPSLLSTRPAAIYTPKCTLFPKLPIVPRPSFPLGGEGGGSSMGVTVEPNPESSAASARFRSAGPTRANSGSAPLRRHAARCGNRGLGPAATAIRSGTPANGWPRSGTHHIPPRGPSGGTGGRGRCRLVCCQLVVGLCSLTLTEEGGRPRGVGAGRGSVHADT